MAVLCMSVAYVRHLNMRSLYINCQSNGIVHSNAAQEFAKASSAKCELTLILQQIVEMHHRDMANTTYTMSTASLILISLQYWQLSSKCVNKLFILKLF